MVFAYLFSHDNTHTHTHTHTRTRVGGGAVVGTTEMSRAAFPERAQAAVSLAAARKVCLGFADKRGTRVCQVTRDKKELDLTTPDIGCSLFLLTFGCDSSRYYRVVHGTALIPNKTHFPCRTRVACLFAEDKALGSGSKGSQTFIAPHLLRRRGGAPAPEQPLTAPALSNGFLRLSRRGPHFQRTMVWPYAPALPSWAAMRLKGVATPPPKGGDSSFRANRFCNGPRPLSPAPSTGLHDSLPSPCS